MNYEVTNRYLISENGEQSVHRIQHTSRTNKRIRFVQPNYVQQVADWKAIQNLGNNGSFFAFNCKIKKEAVKLQLPF